MAAMEKASLEALPVRDTHGSFTVNKTPSEKILRQ